MKIALKFPEHKSKIRRYKLQIKNKSVCVHDGFFSVSINDASNLNIFILVELT